MVVHSFKVENWSLTSNATLILKAIVCLVGDN